LGDGFQRTSHQRVQQGRRGIDQARNIVVPVERLAARHPPVTAGIAVDALRPLLDILVGAPEAKGHRRMHRDHGFRQADHLAGLVQAEAGRADDDFTAFAPHPHVVSGVMEPVGRHLPAQILGGHVVHGGREWESNPPGTAWPPLPVMKTGRSTGVRSLPVFR